MNKQTTKIIMGLLLVLLMGVLVGCPTEAPKEKKKGDDGPTPRVPIVIDGTTADWRTENITGGVRILEYIGTDKALITSLVIPTTVNKKNVVEIKGFTNGGGATVGIFRQNVTTPNDNITSVDMFNASHLKAINDRAFFYMTNVASVVFPDGLETIGKEVFSFSGLISITFPDSVTTIGEGAFGSSKLKSIIIPNTVTAIGDAVFSSSALESITLPDSLETIGKSAFSYTKLTSITLPKSLTTIGNQAFFNTDLTSITIPASVKTIEGAAFMNTKLTSVTILRNAIGEANPLTTAGTVIFYATPIADADKPSQIYYPKGTTYQDETNWTAYKDTTTWIEGTPP